MTKKKQWQDLSTGRKVVATIMGLVQVTLAISAWADLAKRPAAQVNGSKRRWAAIIAINFIGPIAYFTKGRRA